MANEIDLGQVKLEPVKEVERSGFRVEFDVDTPVQYLTADRRIQTQYPKPRVEKAGKVGLWLEPSQTLLVPISTSEEGMIEANENIVMLGLDINWPKIVPGRNFNILLINNSTERQFIEHGLELAQVFPFQPKSARKGK